VPKVSANGLELEYESLGDPAHPPVLLIMGLGVQMILWPDALCEKLVGAGFRVVRFDNRDAGLSTCLDHLGTPNITRETIKFLLHMKVKAPYYIDDMASDTAALIDALALGRPHVVGASMGGMIAQNLAANFPDRVASLTSIMSTTGKRSLPGPTWKARAALLEKPAKRGDIEGAIRRMMKLLRTIGSRTHPAEEGYLRVLCERHVKRCYHPPSVARQLIAIAGTGDRTAVVRRIKAPTLVLHGDEDPLLRPACGAETARVIHEAGGKVIHTVVPGMGHDLPVPLMEPLAANLVAHFRGQ
jgi:proline iminopeptidase